MIIEPSQIKGFHMLKLAAKLQLITENTTNKESYESSYVENKLDIAFIADDSREVRSQSHSLSREMSSSISMMSEGESISGISGISRIYGGDKSLSLFNQASISEMDEWQNEATDLFEKMKRKTRASTRAAKMKFQPDNISEQDFQSSSNNQMDMNKLGQCSKKRLCEKMKLITINSIKDSKSNQIIESRNENKYMSKLRSSKTKKEPIIEYQNDSSSQQIREIVKQLDRKPNRQYFTIKGAKR